MEVEELKKLDVITLVDMLAGKTADYMHLLKTGGKEDEYDNCKKLIKLLTREIQERKNEAFEE